MAMQISPSTKAVGFWSAVFATAFSLTYVVGQLAEWMGWLGYVMSVATLLAAMTFTGKGLERVVRLFLTANGLLLPFIALQMYFHPLIWIAALWAVTFPGSTWSLALLFRRAAIAQPAFGAETAPGP